VNFSEVELDSTLWGVAGQGSVGPNPLGTTRMTCEIFTHLMRKYCQVRRRCR